MAEKIKKFFAKKKTDAKFKLAGPGHKLNDTASSSSSIKTPQVPTKRLEPSGEARQATKQAAEAALARLQSKKKDTNFNTSLAAIQVSLLLLNFYHPCFTSVGLYSLKAIDCKLYYFTIFYFFLLKYFKIRFPNGNQEKLFFAFKFV